MRNGEMRIPKYRVWIKAQKKMIGEYRGGYVDYVRACGLPHGGEIDVQIVNDAAEHENYSFDEVVLMEYIGHDDKEKVSIYEDDIVEAFMAFTTLIKVVEWVNDMDNYCVNPGFVLTKGDGGESGMTPFSSLGVQGVDKYKVKVIGNLHENPELKKRITWSDERWKAYCK